jgi:hypothetical protein
LNFIVASSSLQSYCLPHSHHILMLHLDAAVLHLHHATDSSNRMPLCASVGKHSFFTGNECSSTRFHLEALRCFVGAVFFAAALFEPVFAIAFAEPSAPFAFARITACSLAFARVLPPA